MAVGDFIVLGLIVIVIVIVIWVCLKKSQVNNGGLQRRRGKRTSSESKTQSSTDEEAPWGRNADGTERSFAEYMALKKEKERAESPLSGESIDRFDDAISKIKHPSREKELKEVLGLIEQDASDDQLQVAVHKLTHICGEMFDAIMPLLESIIPPSHTFDATMARIGAMIIPVRKEDQLPPGLKYAGSRIIDICSFYEAVSRYLGSFNRQEEAILVKTNIVGILDRLDRPTDAQQVGVLAMSLAWLGEQERSEVEFSRALALAGADKRLLQAVNKNGEVLEEQRPGTISGDHVMRYYSRGKMFPTRSVWVSGGEPQLIETWRENSE